jgi:Zn-dependent protease with chaperone function
MNGNEYVYKNSNVDIFSFPNPSHLIYGLGVTIISISFIGLIIYGFVNITGVIPILSSLNVPTFFIFIYSFYAIFVLFVPFTFVALTLFLWFQKKRKDETLPSFQVLEVIDPEKNYQMQKLLKNIGVKTSINIITTTQKKSPRIFDHRHPKIILPQKILEEYPDDAQDAIIIHEASHFLNNDILISELSLVSRNSMLVCSGLFLFVSLLTYLLLFNFLKPIHLLIPNLDIFDFISSYFPDFILSNISVIVVNAIVLVLSHYMILLFRERRADIRARYIAPQKYFALLALISRGTNKPNIIERLLQLGPDRWTRHESIIEPYRLLRPNIGFIFLLGIIFGIFMNIQSFNINIITEIIKRVHLSLIINDYNSYILKIVIFILILFVLKSWINITMLTYLALAPRSFSKLKNSLLWLGGIYFALFGGEILGNFLSFGNLFAAPQNVIFHFLMWVIFFFNPTDLGGLLLGTWLGQKSFMSAYLIAPILKRKMALWFVYIPYFWGYVLPSILSIYSFLSVDKNIQLMREYYQNEYISLMQQLGNVSLIPSLSSLWDITKSLDNNIEHYAGAYLIYFVVYILISFTVGFTFNKCCCCGEDTDAGGNVDYKCPKCGYPLGKWITADPLPPFDLYKINTPSRNSFDYKLAIIPELKTTLIVVAFGLEILISAFICYRLFSSQFIHKLIQNIFTRIFWGSFSCLILSIFLFLLSGILFYYVGWIKPQPKK